MRSNSSSSSDPEACGVAAREAGQEKAISLLKCALEQEGLSVLSIKALTYPLALSFVLEHGLQARDALHLGVAVIAHATKISTSNADFSDRIEQLGRDAQNIGIRMPRLVKEMYGMTDQEARMLEQSATLTLSNLSVERAGFRYRYRVGANYATALASRIDTALFRNGLIALQDPLSNLPSYPIASFIIHNCE